MTIFSVYRCSVIKSLQYPYLGGTKILILEKGKLRLSKIPLETWSVLSCGWGF